MDINVFGFAEINWTNLQKVKTGLFSICSITVFEKIDQLSINARKTKLDLNCLLLGKYNKNVEIPTFVLFYRITNQNVHITENQKNEIIVFMA